MTLDPTEDNLLHNNALLTFSLRLVKVRLYIYNFNSFMSLYFMVEDRVYMRCFLFSVISVASYISASLSITWFTCLFGKAGLISWEILSVPTLVSLIFLVMISILFWRLYTYHFLQWFSVSTFFMAYWIQSVLLGASIAF